jgi:hypothetical protein
MCDNAVELIDSPVVGCARNEAILIRKSGKADEKIRVDLVALEHVRTAGGDIVKIFAEIHIVRGSGRSRRPLHAHPSILEYGTISRDRLYIIALCVLKNYKYYRNYPC